MNPCGRRTTPAACPPARAPRRYAPTPRRDPAMPPAVNSPPPPASRPPHRLVSRTRALLRTSWVATGLGITLGLLLGTLAVLAVLDLFLPLAPVNLPFTAVVVPLDPIFRCVALVLVVGPSALALYHGVIRPL